MSEREQEQFEAQRRVRSFFVVFSCGGGDGPGELEVSRANFFPGGGIFSGTWHFESSEIDDRDHEQAHQNFSDDAGLPLPRKAL
jgi:hypothetical protein